MALGKKKKDKEQKVIQGSISEFPFLMAIKPKESYVFRSNDYQSDGKFYTILSYFHKLKLKL